MQSENLIFDLDGTLWNSIQCVVDGWNAVLREMNKPDTQFTYEDLKPLVGKSRPQIFKVLFGALTEEELHKLDTAANEAMFAEIKATGAQIYPKVDTTIEKLLGADYTLAIVSNCQAGYIDLFLDQTGLHNSFVDQECWGVTLQPKSENILSLMKRNSMTNAIYIGDTRTDQVAASEAGIPFIYASYGFGEVEKLGKEDKEIASFLEILNFI